MVFGSAASRLVRPRGPRHSRPRSRKQLRGFPHDPIGDEPDPYMPRLVGAASLTEVAGRRKRLRPRPVRPPNRWSGNRWDRLLLQTPPAGTRRSRAVLRLVNRPTTRPCVKWPVASSEGDADEREVHRTFQRPKAARDCAVARRRLHSIFSSRQQSGRAGDPGFADHLTA